MKVGLTVCSNGQDPGRKKQIEDLIRVFEAMGIDAVLQGRFHRRHL